MTTARCVSFRRASIAVLTKRMISKTPFTNSQILGIMTISDVPPLSLCILHGGVKRARAGQRGGGLTDKELSSISPNPTPSIAHESHSHAAPLVAHNWSFEI